MDVKIFLQRLRLERLTPDVWSASRSIREILKASDCDVQKLHTGKFQLLITKLHQLGLVIGTNSSNPEILTPISDNPGINGLVRIKLATLVVQPFSSKKLRVLNILSSIEKNISLLRKELESSPEEMVEEIIQNTNIIPSISTFNESENVRDLGLDLDFT